MLTGIGVDIIEISRIKQAVEKHGSSFLNRIFSEKEINYCRQHKAIKYPELAVRFAAKEAYAKALGTGIGQGKKKKDSVFWKDIEIGNDSLGKPHIYLKGKLAKKTQVSLSHSRNSAVAIVIIEG